MTNPSHAGTPLPTGATIPPGTLRATLEQARTEGHALTMAQSVAVIVPLAVELAVRHSGGEQLYVHPSSIVQDAEGNWTIGGDLALRRPGLPRDKACMAPEERDGRPGDAKASVFALGAIFYEMVTGLSVGPGMRRPKDVQADLPDALESILSKALVADASHRPDDLNALAQAFHALAPGASVAPPPANGDLDHAGALDVDVSLSMMPPAPSNLAVSPYDMAVQQAQPDRPAPLLDTRTEELASLKSRLESDPRPRYAVVKNGMDHGPFSAVELLQQIATHTFEETDILKDSFSHEMREIREWAEFAPFAEQARIHRNIKAEKAAFEQSVVSESRSTRGKALLGIAAVGVVLAIAAGWFLTQRGRRDDSIAVQGDLSTSIETDAGLDAPKRSGSKGGGARSKGGIPVLGRGMSCETAQARYVEEIKVGGPKMQADITRAQYGALLNRGGYFSHCNVPQSMGVSICAAVQNGHAVGVTIVTKPANGGVQRCVASAVRRLSFPSHPKLDVTRTYFPPAR